MTSPVAGLVARQNFSTFQHISLGRRRTRATIGSVAAREPPADATPSQVWFKDYAWVMNLMCAIPIFGIVMLVWLIANHEHVTCFNRKKVRDWAASAQRRGSNVDLAARAEAQAETTESRCGGCLCCCGPRPDVLVEHEAQREARIAAHRGVLPGLEPGDA